MNKEAAVSHKEEKQIIEFTLELGQHISFCDLNISGCAHELNY